MKFDKAIKPLLSGIQLCNVGWIESEYTPNYIHLVGSNIQDDKGKLYVLSKEDLRSGGWTEFKE